MSIRENLTLALWALIALAVVGINRRLAALTDDQPLTEQQWRAVNLDPYDVEGRWLP